MLNLVPIKLFKNRQRDTTTVLVDEELFVTITSMNLMLPNKELKNLLNPYITKYGNRQVDAILRSSYKNIFNLVGLCCRCDLGFKTDSKLDRIKKQLISDLWLGRI